MSLILFEKYRVAESNSIDCEVCIKGQESNTSLHLQTTNFFGKKILYMEKKLLTYKDVRSS